jgi:uncharacterized protein YtpQ (UPF0354 family)
VAGSPLNAIAYVKPDLSDDAPGPPVDFDRNAPPLQRPLGDGLAVTYVMEEGSKLVYVHERDLEAAGIETDDLHGRAIQNLAKLSEGRVNVRRNGPIWAVFLDGAFEASLVLLDRFWERDVREHHPGEIVVALPARDVLCFCDRASSVGIAELRTVIKRVWASSNHLISDGLFLRRGQTWVRADGLS